MTKYALLLGAICALTGALLLPSTATAACKGNRVLVDGRCVEPNTIKCRVDTDCPGDMICKAERCVEMGGPSGSVTAEDVRFALDKAGDARRRLGASRAFSYIGLGFAVTGTVVTMVFAADSYSPGFGHFYFGIPGLGMGWLMMGGFGLPFAAEGFTRINHGLARLDKQPHRTSEFRGLVGLFFGGMALQAGAWGFGMAFAFRGNGGVYALSGSLMLAGTAISAIALFALHHWMEKGIAKLDRLCNEYERQVQGPRRVTPTVALAPVLLSEDERLSGAGLGVTGRW